MSEQLLLERTLLESALVIKQLGLFNKIEAFIHENLLSISLTSILDKSDYDLFQIPALCIKHCFFCPESKYISFSLAAILIFFLRFLRLVKAKDQDLLGLTIRSFHTKGILGAIAGRSVSLTVFSFFHGDDCSLGCLLDGIGFWKLMG